MGRHTRGVKTVRQLVRLLAEPRHWTQSRRHGTSRALKYNVDHYRQQFIVDNLALSISYSNTDQTI